MSETLDPECVGQTTPFVSVIIPTRNMRETLKFALKSLLEQSYPSERYEVIVVDNSSTDGTGEMVRALIPEAACALRYYRKADEGPGRARNFGVAHAGGEIIAFTDADCVADTHWIEKGVAEMIEGVGLVQGMTLPNPSQTMSTFVHTQEITREDGIYQTCNMFYRKDALEQVGGFSSALGGVDRVGNPMGGEDIDVAWRVRKRGWKSSFAREALVYHHVFRLTPLRYIIDAKKRRVLFYALPLVVKTHPELRRERLYFRMFLEMDNALFVLFLAASLVSSLVHPVFVILAGPYVVHLLRRSFRGRSLSTFHRGAFVCAVFLLSDLVDFLLLSSGSLWHRSLIL